MLSRIRQVIDQMLYAERPMIVRDGDETYTVGQRDVEDIMKACGCGNDEARERLADWVVDKLSDRDKR